MLTNRGIEANPNKCKEIIYMIIPSKLKEVQHLTGRLATLPCFLSCVGDKSIHFFVAVKKSAKFQWTEECEDAFKEVKCFMSAPLILIRPKENRPFILHLAVSEKAMSFVLVKKTEEGEKPMCFVNKVLRVAKFHYQKIEHLRL